MIACEYLAAYVFFHAYVYILRESELQIRIFFFSIFIFSVFLPTSFPIPPYNHRSHAHRANEEPSTICARMLSPRSLASKPDIQFPGDALDIKPPDRPRGSEIDSTVRGRKNKEKKQMGGNQRRRT